MDRARGVAHSLLSVGAVKLNVGQPFTFVSGIKSPIYCDNRKMIGVNDILSDVSSEKIFQNISKILDILNKRFERTIVISVLPTMYIDKNKKIKNLNFFLREQLFTDKLMIDNLFLNNMGVIDNKYSSDGVHLSPIGYQLLNKKIKEVLED